MFYPSGFQSAKVYSDPQEIRTPRTEDGERGGIQTPLSQKHSECKLPPSNLLFEIKSGLTLAFFFVQERMETGVLYNVCVSV